MLIFGPAYLDIVVDIDQPLLPADLHRRLDQSLPALGVTPRQDCMLVLEGETGDDLRIHLPRASNTEAATYALAEPVLARLLGESTIQTVIGEYTASGVCAQLGGMGAGYAKAFGGTLRMPFGRDEMAERILRQLAACEIRNIPRYLDCPTDISLVLLSAHGDKLAVGVREAMVRWRASEEDRPLVAKASALVFCGAPTVLAADVLSWQPNLPVMYAPAMRNVRDVDFPLAALAPHISYLTLNALEWEHLEGKERCREYIPIITITEGAAGSRILLRQGEEIFVPAVPCSGELNTNRAGETYASTFFKVLLHEAPDFFRTGKVAASLAQHAGAIAAQQAARQLKIVEFAFPPDDWMA